MNHEHPNNNPTDHAADEMLTLCEIWGRGAFLHLCFSSVGCRFRKAGYCTICNYGAGKNISAEEALRAIDQALEQRREPIQELLLGTCGSILDEAEMPWQTLECILTRISRETIPTVLLETHYTTVNLQRLRRIKELLPGSEVVIEMGFESANPYVLKHCLNKFLDLDQLAQTTALIKKVGMGVVLNVFLGSPYLNLREQIDDAKNAVEWAVAHGTDRVVVFPANIKPNTPLWDMYQQGYYQRISHWALIELMDRLDDAHLERIELSWYGDRQKIGKSTAAIPPESCPDCDEAVFTFYRDFIVSFTSQERRELLQKIKALPVCSCRKKFLAALN